MKHTTHSRKRALRDKGVSHIISTIIISTVLLIVLFIASFVSTNILAAQMTSTEFEQAKANMQLLDNTIQDTSLRPGAGGYVQFNEREGGIGMYSTADTLTLRVQGYSNTLNYRNLTQLIYRGGTLATAAVDTTKGYTSLDGDLSFAYVNSTQTMGFLRLEQDNGAKIKLDFARFRITPVGLIDSQTSLVQITLIKLTWGTFSGSGTIRVQIQNTATNTTVWQFATGSLTLIAQHTTPQTTITQNCIIPQVSGATKTVVVISEIQVRVSIS